MIVDEYNSCDDIWVKFIENGNRANTSWRHFCTGSVSNVYDKSVYGIGYIGEGTYKPSLNNVNTPQYDSWQKMLQRCYSESYHRTRPSYKDCSVVEEWHNFQNFAQWYNENYYEIEGERMSLDKDILNKGNKIYSPNTCVFVPTKINSLFIKRDSKRGTFPIGVTCRNERKERKYYSQCSNGQGKQVDLGYFTTSEEAFYAYKIYKEKLIKQIADEYKDSIPTKLYNAMYTYEVEITD